MTPREQTGRRAFYRLGPVRLKSFFDAIRGESGCLAIKLITEAMAGGQSLEAIFFDGDEFGYQLDVKGRGRKFRIAFACVPGPMVGDGAEWDVEFDKTGRVIRIEADKMWIYWETPNLPPRRLLVARSFEYEQST